MVCGKPLTDYALIGKKNGMEVAFCTEHIPDCAACDSCDLRCVRCDIKLKVKKMSGLAKGLTKEKRHHNM